LLAPGSDIDLLFLLPGRQTPRVEKIVETMLYILWDLRQKVGHATRSVDECLRQAKADMTIRTTLLEARFILGESALFDELRERFDKEIVAIPRANSWRPNSPNATPASSASALRAMWSSPI